MRKRKCMGRVPLEQALWLACAALGLGIILCLLIGHTFFKWMLGTALLAVGLWQLLKC